MDDQEPRRRHLLQRIAEELRSLEGRTGCRLSPGVEAALTAVPRHMFVGPGLQPAAYDDTALPIGWRQTISQPSIVALMTELLRPQAGQTVLEVGTGSGYQAAVLSQMVEQVYSIETIPQLAEQASARLKQLGITNVEVRCGDGRLGWPEHAPYDGIIVTAAADKMPSALPPQLKPGARLVLPIGRHPYAQNLWVFDKKEDGAVEGRVILAVAFVPLVEPRDGPESNGA